MFGSVSGIPVSPHSAGILTNKLAILGKEDGAFGEVDAAADRVVYRPFRSFEVIEILSMEQPTIVTVIAPRWAST